jgi:hypothetical protein
LEWVILHINHSSAVNSETTTEGAICENNFEDLRDNILDGTREALIQVKGDTDNFLGASAIGIHEKIRE